VGFRRAVGEAICECEEVGGVGEGREVGEDEGGRKVCDIGRYCRNCPVAGRAPVISSVLILPLLVSGEILCVATKTSKIDFPLLVVSTEVLVMYRHRYL
jgi:hypothetical protein